MQTKRPAFQFYPADWLNDWKIKTATFEEKGFLIDLMCLLHQSPKYGYLTKEMEQTLPTLLAKDRRTSERLLAKVRQKSLMKVDELTGELFNKRMVTDEKLRMDRAAGGSQGAAFGERGKEFGKLGGRPRKKPPLKPPPSSSSSSSYSIKENIKEKKLENGFDEFYKLYPRKIAKIAALKAWGKLNDEERRISIEVIPRHVKGWQGVEMQHIPYPATWLNAGRWADQVIADVKKPFKNLPPVTVMPEVDQSKLVSKETIERLRAERLNKKFP